MSEQRKQRWSFLIALGRQLKQAYDESPNEEYEAFCEVLDLVIADLMDRNNQVDSDESAGGEESEIPFDGPVPRSGTDVTDRAQGSNGAPERATGRGIVRIANVAGTLHTRHRRR